MIPQYRNSPVLGEDAKAALERFDRDAHDPAAESNTLCVRK